MNLERAQAQQINYGSHSNRRPSLVTNLVTSSPEFLASSNSWTSSFTRAAHFASYRDRAPEAAVFDDGDDADVESLVDCDPDALNVIVPPVSTGFQANDIEFGVEEEPLLKPTVELYVKSTFQQSIFNSSNILMGIGLLSYPYAFKLTGMVVGIFLVLLFAIVTRHTGRLLQHCLDYEHAKVPLNNYGDLGELAFGRIGRTTISVIFFLELCAACVALVILSADSIVALFPSLSLNFVKVAVVMIIFPMTLPKSLSFASNASLIGVLALVNLMLILIIDGFSVTESPGSIWVPADFTVYPSSYFPIPLAFGLLMAGFSGHSVFPNIYRDMAEPKKYPELVDSTYSIVTTLYLTMASVGYIMFGSSVKEEITQNLPLIASYSPFLTKITVGLIAINPITKCPLNLNPINGQIDIVLLSFLPSNLHKYSRTISCVFSSMLILVIAIKFPAFDSMMALLGSFFSFTVSVVFPELCYLRLFNEKLDDLQKLLHWSILVVGTIMGLLGTIWVFI